MLPFRSPKFLVYSRLKKDFFLYNPKTISKYFNLEIMYNFSDITGLQDESLSRIIIKYERSKYSVITMTNDA